MAFFTAADLPEDSAGSRLVKEGRLIRVTRAVYSDEVNRSPEDIVRSSWREILGILLPGAVITGRSAFIGRPVDSFLFVSYSTARRLDLPGLTVVASKGLLRQAGDVSLGNDIYLASEQRALLDNTVTSRAVGGRPARTLNRGELHDEITRLVTTRSSVQQERLSAAVADYAKETGAGGADDIDVFFRYARGETSDVESKSRAFHAAQSGEPLDARRVELFTQLAMSLADHSPKMRPQKDGQALLPFFEAYFSNYIEGTEFTVEEAAAIALHGEMPAARPADAHDIAGTYSIVNDAREMGLVFRTFDEFLSALKRRHASIMVGRPSNNPGQLKTRDNRAGGTTFVSHAQVLGTLAAGWERLADISDPFARAAYTMFLVSEVHPFSDGNGRAARIMMNGELIQAGHTRIVVPTALRNEYITSLVGLTANGHHQGLLAVLDFAQRFTSQMDWSDLGRATRMLTATRAFMEPAQADALGVRLTLPRQLEPGWEFRQPDEPARSDEGPLPPGALG